MRWWSRGMASVSASKLRSLTVVVPFPVLERFLRGLLLVLRQLLLQRLLLHGQRFQHPFNWIFCGALFRISFLDIVTLCNKKLFNPAIDLVSNAN